MQNSFFCEKIYINLYKSASLNSKISSQLLYGEKFKILKRKKEFLKVKTNYDNYVGYIKKSNFADKFKLCKDALLLTWSRSAAIEAVLIADASAAYGLLMNICVAYEIMHPLR